MAYKVTFNVPDRVLGHADIEFSVEENGGKIGTLLISKGALVWYPKSKSARHARLPWLAFAKAMAKFVK